MADYKKIVAFFDDYIGHYKDLLDFEYSKIDMLNKNQIEKLSNSLSVEQALIMKGNSLEAKRIKLVEGTGKTFAELIENAPDEFKETLMEQHDKLSALVYRIKELNDGANAVVSKRLKIIQDETAELDVYDGKGSVKREHATRAAIFKNV